MYQKVSRIVFVVLFLLMIAIPMATTNLQNNKVSESENRRLTSQPELYHEDGSLNKNFLADFEAWINDNIGQRARMVIHNARIQYYLFSVLSNNSNMYLGPHKELNYATETILKDYQHDNLYTEEQLREFAKSMQCLSDYAKKTGSEFYYYQCWDKHSIYPEHFPRTVIQRGEESKTDGLVRVLNDLSDVNVISPKNDLIKGKSEYSTYSVWGDPTHWTPRGAYIGYKNLMHAINNGKEKTYKILQESDYNITITDQGSTLFGGIHRSDYLERFDIIEPKASLTNEKLELYAEDQRHKFYTNNYIGNNTRLLVIGDSYFNNFLIDDLAESFHEVIIIWGDYLYDFQHIIDEYNPDIVIVEAAERVDRRNAVIAGAKAIVEAEKK